jgi:acetate kinase
VRILVLNAGSSTLKASVLDTPGRDSLVARTVEWRADAPDAEREAALREVLDATAAGGVPADSIAAVGHRVVHGGSRFTQAVLADEAVADAIDELAELAPLHNPAAAATLRTGLRVLPGIPHVAAFDTAFHASLPEVGFRYPVPERWYAEWGIRRYGFHGLSVEWSSRRAAELLESPVGALRLVVAHLGSGCSVTAIDGGRSVATSMGLTPLEGLMMGTRAGSIDPGIIFQLLRRGIPAEALEAVLEHRSGLVGVAGSQDVRELLAREADGDVAAALALELFVRLAAAWIAAVATTLPALDALVFTAGIGENAAAVRHRICSGLALLGVPRPAEGTAGADEVLAPGRPAVVRVHAREDVVIAEATARLAAASRAPGVAGQVG